LGAALVLLLALVLVVGWPTLDNGLYGDDLVAAHSHVFGGVASLSPIGVYTADDAPGYWARQLEIRRLLSTSDHRLELYHPPLPTALLKLEATLFGGWLPGYHAINVLLHLLLVLALFLLARALGLGAPAACAVAAIVAVHPLLAPAMNSPGAQRYYLAALLALLAAWRGLVFIRTGRGRDSVTALLVLGLLADMSALSALALLVCFAYRSDRTQPEGQRASDLRNRALIVALVLMAFRLLMPIASGAHGIEGYYQQLLMSGLLGKLGIVSSDLFLMMLVLPPQLVILIPAILFLAGVLGPVLLLVGLLRAIAARSGAAQAGLLLALTAWLASVFGPVRLEDALLPVAGMALVLVEMLVAIGTRLKIRALRAGLALALAALFIPSAVVYHLAVQDWTANYSITSRRLAEQLDRALPVLQPGARVLLANAWGGAVLLPQEWRLLSGREDIELRVLSFDPAPVPFGLPLPTNLQTAWMLPYTRWPESDTAYRVTFLENRNLRLVLEKGVYFNSLGDLAYNGDFIRVDPTRIDTRGMTVTPGPFREGEPQGFMFRFTPSFAERQTVVMAWRGGRWQVETP
jgi:hypothetical protein